MNYRKGMSILAAAAVVGIAGCAVPPNDPYQTSYPGAPAYPTYPNAPAYPSQEIARYGYVESVETVTPDRRTTGPGIGGQVQIDQLDRVVVDSLHAARENQYAQPASPPPTPR